MENKIIDPTVLLPRLYCDRSHTIYHRDLGRHMYRHGGDTPLVEIQMLEDLSLQFHTTGATDALELLTVAERARMEPSDDASLISTAFVNLHRQFGDAIQIQTLDTGCLRIRAHSGCDASFLLLANVWTTLAEQTGAHPYAIVPTQDLLLVAPAHNRQAILVLQQLVRDTFAQVKDTELLSKAIYQQWEGEWKIVATAF